MGTGIARGFLAAMDTAWMVRSWGQGNTPSEVLAERSELKWDPNEVKEDLWRISFDKVGFCSNIPLRFFPVSERVCIGCFLRQHQKTSVKTTASTAWILLAAIPTSTCNSSALLRLETCIPNQVVITDDDHDVENVCTGVSSHRHRWGSGFKPWCSQLSTPKTHTARCVLLHI